MNGLIPLSETSIQALGWMLFHFVWQGFAVAAILAAARVVIKNPRLRYTVACGALLTMVSLAAATLLTQDLETRTQFAQPGSDLRGISSTAATSVFLHEASTLRPTAGSDKSGDWAGITTSLQ